MASARVSVIINPSAGSVSELDELRDRVRRHLPGAEILFPRFAGEAGLIARDLARAGVESIVAAGGDGTLSEVLNGIAGHLDRVRLGLLPLGTGNDFARSAGISRKLDEALETLRAGRVTEIDVVRVTNDRPRLMINASAGGFAAKVDDKLIEEDVKSRWGPLAYARAFAGVIGELSHYRTEIILDDTERMETPAYNVVIANGRHVAAGVPIAPRARLDDGLADLVVLPVASLPEVAALGAATLAGKHLESEKLIFRRARKIEIRADPPMRFNSDGEMIGFVPVTFEVLPGALRFIAGPLPAPR